MCAGIVSVAKPISIECQMANYSNNLYQQLEEETGVKTGQPFLNFNTSVISVIPLIRTKINPKNNDLKKCNYPSLLQIVKDIFQMHMIKIYYHLNRYILRGIYKHGAAMPLCFTEAIFKVMQLSQCLVCLGIPLHVRLSFFIACVIAVVLPWVVSELLSHEICGVVYSFCVSGYVNTGSLCLAQNQDRLISLKRLASRLR